MLDLSRRSVIKLLGLIPAAAVVKTTLLDNQVERNSVFENAWQVWKRKKSIMPAAYIKATSIEAMSSLDKEAFIRNEFKNDKVLSVNGLVLSEVETAILAQLHIELT